MNNQLQICKVVCTTEFLQVVKLRGMYLEDESHSYHISSLMDRKMKGEKLDGNLVKGRKRSGGSLLCADRSEA